MAEWERLTDTILAGEAEWDDIVALARRLLGWEEGRDG
jgi:hypothetical protein